MKCALRNLIINPLKVGIWLFVCQETTFSHMYHFHRHTSNIFSHIKIKGAMSDSFSGIQIFFPISGHWLARCVEQTLDYFFNLYRTPIVTFTMQKISTTGRMPSRRYYLKLWVWPFLTAKKSFAFGSVQRSIPTNQFVLGHGIDRN